MAPVERPLLFALEDTQAPLSRLKPGAHSEHVGFPPVDEGAVHLAQLGTPTASSPHETHLCPLVGSSTVKKPSLQASFATQVVVPSAAVLR